MRFLHASQTLNDARLGILNELTRDYTKTAWLIATMAQTLKTKCASVR